MDLGSSILMICLNISSNLINCYLRNECFFQNDTLGCNSVSWAPYNPSSSHTGDGSVVYRLVTGSCDNVVRIWKKIESSGNSISIGWTEEAKSCTTPHSGTKNIVIQCNYIFFMCESICLMFRLGKRCCMGSKFRLTLQYIC